MCLRIANGEKIIEQIGPDDIEVQFREREVDDDSWLQELIMLLDEAEREMRKSKRHERRP